MRLGLRLRERLRSYLGSPWVLRPVLMVQPEATRTQRRRKDLFMIKDPFLFFKVKLCSKGRVQLYWLNPTPTSKDKKTNYHQECFFHSPIVAQNSLGSKPSLWSCFIFLLPALEIRKFRLFNCLVFLLRCFLFASICLLFGISLSDQSIVPPKRTMEPRVRCKLPYQFHKNHKTK